MLRFANRQPDRPKICRLDAVEQQAETLERIGMKPFQQRIHALTCYPRPQTRPSPLRALDWRRSEQRHDEKPRSAVVVHAVGYAVWRHEQINRTHRQRLAFEQEEPLT